ncbi:MAG: hypothetical protein M3083_13125 [Actinomycetota bacterium]|nr:hypothetical protein [Actinomycetota bacterium]
MIDQLETLRTLAERPSSPPEPVSELWRRVDARRRGRRRRRTVLAGVVAVAVFAVVVPMLGRAGGRRINVNAGQGATPTNQGGKGVPSGTRLDFAVPAGWQTLFAQGTEIVVGTTTLSSSDLALALLARDDAAFEAFPANGVVVVVGLDPVQAKYLTTPSGANIGPGPAYDLGPAQTLTGGVQVRRGDIPQSILRIASYAGPRAPADRLQQAQTIAQGLRLVATGDPSVPGPRPPAGSSIAFPSGPLPVPDNGPPVVAAPPTGGMTLTLTAKSDCGYLHVANAQQAIAGACLARPAAPTATVAGRAVLLPGLPPSPASSGGGSRPKTGTPTAVMFRVGTGVHAVTARFTDGGSVAAVIGSDGWGLAVGQGRIFALTGTDWTGRSTPPAFVQ